MLMIKLAFLILFITPPRLAMAQDCKSPLQTEADFYLCAVELDPNISSLTHRTAERSGRTKEASQFPNPLAESELTFGSEGRKSLSLIQPIEIGGRRSARIGLAEAENRASIIEDRTTLLEASTNLATALVRYRQLKMRATLLEEMQASLGRLVSRLHAKAVRTPEERSALTIFRMQDSVLNTRSISIKKELGEVTNELEASIGRKLGESDLLSSSERRNWPDLDSTKIGESFESRLASTLLERARSEADLQASLAWPEVAIGPVVEKDAGSELSWGAKAEFSVPFFNLNGGAKERSRAELARTESMAARIRLKDSANLKTLLEEYRDISKLLMRSPSQAEIKKSVTESLQLFSRGMIQPAAIVEIYRSALEALEAVQEKEVTIYQLYWKLRAFSGDVPKEFI